MSGSHRAPERTGPGRWLWTWVDRRAARRAARDAADRAAGRAERVAAPRLGPRSTRLSSRLSSRGGRRPGMRWYRTGPGQLAIAGTAVVVAVLLRTFAPGGTDTPGVPLGQGLPHFGADWTTSDGSKYRITVTPLSELSSRPSDGGCVPSPADGFVNARFAIRVSNFSGRSADVPAVDFGANLDASGTPDPTVVEIQPQRHNVALSPRAGNGCRAAASLGPAGRDRMDDGEVLDLVGVVGGIRVPVQPGVSVIIRYRAESGPTALLAPFPAFPVGS